MCISAIFLENKLNLFLFFIELASLSIADDEFRHLIHFIGKLFGMIWIVFKSDVIDFKTEWAIGIDETCC